jgi:hypothetical protein
MPFTDRHLAPSAITQTKPVRVTVEGSNLSNGQFVRATNFFSPLQPHSTGMHQLNNRLLMVWNTTADTFDLFDEMGLPIDGTNYTAFVANDYSQFTLTGPDLDVQNVSD